jgi:hypothetical protein
MSTIMLNIISKLFSNVNHYVEHYLKIIPDREKRVKYYF